MTLSQRMGGYFGAPPGADSVESQNLRHVYRESALIGVINAGSTFVPVFLARLGATNLQVGLFAAIPSLTGVLLALPVGRLMQTRRNIIPWYSRGRIGGQAAFGAAAIASLVFPGDILIPTILAIWAAAAVFAVVTNVAFSVVMDASSGSRGRFELMSRRWSVMGLVSAAAFAVIGFVLDGIAFPLNYQMVFLGLSLVGLWAYTFGSRIRIPDQAALTHEPGISPGFRLRRLYLLIIRERDFLRFVMRHFVWSVGSAIALPLVPLYHVRVVHAPDIWIGAIGSIQAVMLLVGYAIWRRASQVRGPRFVLAFSTLGAALYPALLSLTTSVAAAAALAGLAAVFISGVNVSLFDRLMATVPPVFGVTFVAVDMSLLYLGGVASPIAGAVLADSLGLGGALVVASMISLTAGVLFWTDRRRP